MSVLSQPQFHDEEAAFAWLEATLWPNGPVCCHCGGIGRIGKIKANPEKRVRHGLRKCGDCGKQFTVKIGTVFEHGRILMCSPEEAHQRAPTAPRPRGPVQDGVVPRPPHP